VRDGVTDVLGARGRRFAISTPHAEATSAGAAAFDAGGNAVDAALASATSLAVVYPHMCGVGGDLFALIREPEGSIVVVNASGAAPAAIDVDAIRARHDEMPEHGPAPVTVPGAVSGWWQLAEHWSDLGFSRALQPAVTLARDGVPVSRSLGAMLAEDPERLLGDPGIAGVFSSREGPLQVGELLRQPALARTLETLAARGPEAFYEGELAEALAEHLAFLGSAMTVDDFVAHEPELDSPISLRYADVDVSAAPPNSQGFVLLECLAAIERLDLDRDPLGPDAAVLAEVFRLGSLEADRHNADPRVARVPVGTLLDEGHIAGLIDQVLDRNLGPPAASLGGDTVALVAADDTGLAVALIQSLADGFGSGILEPSTGILLHNRGAAFVLDPSHPNVLAGGKRPAHTLMPVVVQRHGALAALAGTMGGGAQPQINAMTLLRGLDLGMSPSEAVAAPRWLAGGMSVGVTERRLVAEASVPKATRDSMESAGYRIDLVGDTDEEVGHAHLLLVDGDGTLEAGCDPRSDGEAAAR